MAKKINYLVVILIIIAAFLRLYNLPNTLMFQGDQGRDALIVARIFKNFDPVFIGPVTSVGNMYLGPLYYYFMLPFLFISFPSPTGPAYAVAVVGIITCLLLYLIGKKIFGQLPAIFALFFYSFSAEIIRYSRFSWNPNLAPLFSLLMVFFTFLAWKKHSKYWIAVALCFSVLIQLHYITLLTAGAAGIIWLFQLYEFIKNKQYRHKLKSLLLSTFISAVIILLSLSPIFIFDSQHDWLNAKAFSKMFSQEQILKNQQYSWGQKIIRTAKKSVDRSEQIFFDHLLIRENVFHIFFLTILVLTILDAILKKRIKHKNELIVVSLYLITGILGVAIYEHAVYLHYILYLMPLVCLFYGLVMQDFWQNKNLAFKIIAATFMIYFLILNLPIIPLQDMGWKISDVKAVAQRITEELAENEKYSLILLSESGDIDGQNYRYYLYSLGYSPLEKENFAQANRLFIVNENQKQENIGSLPIYEIVTFPSHEISKTINIPGGPDINILAR